jgi:zinc transport system ATP-binding protein
MTVCSDHAAAQLRGVTVRFGAQVVLDHIDLTIPCHGVTALVGPNGAGKSTLIAALLGQIPYEGEIAFTRHLRNGRARPLFGLAPQKLAFDPDAPVTVLDFLCLADQRAPLWLGKRRLSVEKAMSALQSTRTEHLAQRALGALSGGELKRVLVAAALRNDPDILLLDEPAAGMDAKGDELFCELLDRLSHERDESVLWVSHDLSAVSRHADHVIALRQRVLLQGVPREVLTHEAVTSLYGLMAIGSEPAHCEECAELTPHVHLTKGEHGPAD